MKINLYKISIGIALFISSLSAQEVSIAEDAVTTADPHLKEMAFVVSLQDLNVGQRSISMNWNGHNYSVSSLKKIGSQWVAKVVNYANYCPEGHLTCKGCGQCHKKRCRYYIPPCKLW